MTPELWQHVKKIAAAALEVDPAERDAYIRQACAGDPVLLEQVPSLVASAVAATPYFERPDMVVAPTLYGAGQHIGPYRIIRELASGGMGSVYLAERDDGEFGHRVAIKIVRGGFASAMLVRRFREERRILASLEHPNIARLFDGGTTDTGVPYVVMEYVEGEPIDRFCEHHRLPLRDRLRIFQQVCAAVQFAHQRLVIHRDIKPANILVAGDGTPKLLDFGIARLLDSETGYELTAQTTMRVMTPESASPEQICGQPVTVATDVYALGVLLYRLLTGESPYGDALQREADLIRVVCEQIPERPGARPPIFDRAVPADVDTIVMKALRKEPERRYGSPGELSEDIQRFLDGRPVLASPDSLRYRAGKFVTRHRLGVAAAAAVVVALAGGVAATVWQARVANRERARAEREFNAVRGLAQSMLGELHTAVAKLPGSTPAREILLRRAMEYLDALSGESSGDDGLRREVAMGYLRLSNVQGSSGTANLGDHDAAVKSLRKAQALLDPLARRPSPAPDDRARLATVLAHLAAFYPDDDTDLRQARAIIDSLTADERATDYALIAREFVWHETANKQIAAKQYAGAAASRQRLLEVAEEHVRRVPRDLNANYNLSLADKQLGATLEMLNRRPEAIALYHKALELDRSRVAAEPGKPAWSLDLSFSEGSLASALFAEGDVEGARAGYEQVVALRAKVVALDPSDDFAKLALARGYDRLASVNAALGATAAALDNRSKALALYRERLEAHPERDNVWKEYAVAAFADTQASVELFRTATRDRPNIAAWVTATLDQLQSVQKRWTHDKHTGELPPAADVMAATRARIALR